MKAFIKYLLPLLILLFTLPLNLMADSIKKAPVAEVEEPVYEFKGVMEDVEVVHDFVIKNKGNMVLEIKKVEPGCGCTAVSYTRFIPPGSVGKITIKFDTAGYGGRDVSKSVLVESTDPQREKFYLRFKGDVESFADINPQRVRLIGFFKEKIKSDILIKSRKKYPFKITGVNISEENAKKVKIELKKLKEGETNEYLLTFESLVDKKERFFDTVKINTDSKLKPVIALPLSAIIFDK